MKKEETFGARLKRLRENSRYKSQDDLADAVGIARQTLSNYEKDTRKPDVEVIKLLAQALNVSVDYLVGLSCVPAPNETVQGIYNKTGLSQDAILRLSVDKAMGEDYAWLLSSLIINDSFKKFIQVLDKYLAGDEYIDGCINLSISQLTQYDDALDEHLTRKAIYKKIAEEYLWKIVDECEAEGE